MKTIGTAVISNTHIREVSKLINPEDSKNNRSTFYGRADSLWNQDQRFCDLFTFLESLVLNDKLYTLPATFEVSKNDLWDTLLNEKIVEILDTTEFSSNIGRSIISRINQIDGFTRLAGSADDIGKPIDKEHIISELKLFYSNKKHGDGNKDQLGFERSYSFTGSYTFTDSHNFDIIGGTSEILFSDTFPDMAKQLVGWLDYAGSGAYEACTSFLRDMYYIFAAEALEIPYYPQFTRAEFAEKFPNYYDLNFKTKLYSNIAKALSETITNVYDDFQEKVAFVPPFASIILSRSKDRSDIIKVALELRYEFEDTREGFNKLEIERRESKNLKERARISQRQRQLLEDASKSFDKLSKLNLQSTIKYIPELIKPALNPTDPTKYSSNLLLQPIELVIEWWRKRPIHKMYSIKDKIFEINDYQNLISKFFKIEKKESRW